MGNSRDYILIPLSGKSEFHRYIGKFRCDAAPTAVNITTENGMKAGKKGRKGGKKALYNSAMSAPNAIKANFAATRIAGELFPEEFSHSHLGLNGGTFIRTTRVLTEAGRG